MAFSVFIIGIGMLVFAAVNVTVSCLRQTRAVSYIAVVSKSTCLYHLYPHAARLTVTIQRGPLRSNCTFIALLVVDYVARYLVERGDAGEVVTRV